jgi:pimeloyl-ACP methyl ester carboxylesterase
MPIAHVADARLYYETHGHGHPLLMLAPGGLLSHVELWRVTRDGKPRDYPDPIAAFSPNFRCIAMDQRNAGRSTAPLRATDGWHTYAEDHLALLDHLGIERFHVLGSCIGASFALNLCELAPDRVTAAILQQPIGLSAANAANRAESFDSWADGLRQREGGVDEAALEALRANLFDGDFVYSVTREAVAATRTPLLILAGNDILHPVEIAREIAHLAPHATLVEDWKGKDRADVYTGSIRRFLAGLDAYA